MRRGIRAVFSIRKFETQQQCHIMYKVKVYNFCNYNNNKQKFTEKFFILEYNITNKITLSE